MRWIFCNQSEAVVLWNAAVYTEEQTLENNPFSGWLGGIPFFFLSWFHTMFTDDVCDAIGLSEADQHKPVAFRNINKLIGHRFTP